jgi:hypothetical protein
MRIISICIFLVFYFQTSAQEKQFTIGGKIEVTKKNINQVDLLAYKIVDSLRLSIIIKTIHVKTNEDFLIRVDLPGKYQFRIIIPGYKDVYVEILVKPEHIDKVIYKRIILKLFPHIPKQFEPETVILGLDSTRL